MKSLHWQILMLLLMPVPQVSPLNRLEIWLENRCVWFPLLFPLESVISLFEIGVAMRELAMWHQSTVWADSAAGAPLLLHAYIITFTGCVCSLTPSVIHNQASLLQKIQKTPPSAVVILRNALPLSFHQAFHVRLTDWLSSIHSPTLTFSGISSHQQKSIIATVFNTLKPLLKLLITCPGLLPGLSTKV